MVCGFRRSSVLRTAGTDLEELLDKVNSERSYIVSHPISHNTQTARLYFSYSTKTGRTEIEQHGTGESRADGLGGLDLSSLLHVNEVRISLDDSLGSDGRLKYLP